MSLRVSAYSRTRLFNVFLSQAWASSTEVRSVEEAERWGADLILMGSRGLGAWNRLLLGFRMSNSWLCVAGFLPTSHPLFSFPLHLPLLIQVDPGRAWLDGRLFYRS